MVNHENGLLRADGSDEIVPLRDIVRESRQVERPAIICKKIDVLARSNDVSITMTFEPTIDIDARATAKFVLAMTKQLREMGFDTKDAPRPVSTYNGQRAKRPDLIPYLKSDGTAMLCKACKKPVVVRANGAAGCSNYADKAFQHHTYIAKDVIENGV